MRTVLTLALQTSAITLMGIGVTFTIITGGIDLSIGSVVALSGTIAVMVALAGVPDLAQHGSLVCWSELYAVSSTG